MGGQYCCIVYSYFMPVLVNSQRDYKSVFGYFLGVIPFASLWHAGSPAKKLRFIERMWNI